MSCDPALLKQVPLFSLLDDDETAVLAAQVGAKEYAPRQRIYKMGDPGGLAYVVVSGRVRLSIVDEDKQEVVIDEPGAGDFFGMASMLEKTPHQTTAVALEPATCLEISREDISVLIRRKPDAGMDMLSVLGRHFHASQQLVRIRAMRNPNELIEEKATPGERVADAVARFGGSWTFIIGFAVITTIYVVMNNQLRSAAWDPYPYILLNLFLSLLAAIQAPVILMSQNRQDGKDRLRGELDFAVNRRAAAEIQNLAGKLNLLDEKIGDLEEVLRIRHSQQAPKSV